VAAVGSNNIHIFTLYQSSIVVHKKVNLFNNLYQVD